MIALGRPQPPADLVAIGAAERFVPAPDLLAWIQAQYLDEAGPLYWPDHIHLRDADLGLVWTNVENARGGKRIVGQAELVKNALGKLPVWPRARAEQQLAEWFGEQPDFIITLDANICSGLDDASFCALIDHELCHCAQKRDEFGSPEFDRMTGRPKFCMRPHDVEEFVSVVARFGIEAAGEQAVELVLAAAERPSIARTTIATACGTCVMRLVA